MKEKQVSKESYTIDFCLYKGQKRKKNRKEKKVMPILQKLSRQK